MFDIVLCLVCLGGFVLISVDGWLLWVGCFAIGLVWGWCLLLCWVRVGVCEDLCLLGLDELGLVRCFMFLELVLG